MGITVIDQGPELFWFVSNALLHGEFPLKHIPNIESAELSILQELPEIVIINGDDKSLHPEQFINRMRNHVFARNTLFVVLTADTSIEFKKSLLIAGAGQIFYRGRGFGPSPKFFASLIKWFLNSKNPDAQIFDYKPVPFPTDAEFTSYGRIGWISSTHCMIESNIDPSPGQCIEFKNPLFEELDIKNLKLECVEKNQVGRYYQYANSLLCKIQSKEPIKDSKKLSAWIANNQDISKHKPIKVVYFESNAAYRDEIKKMVKSDRRYCARGFASLEELAEILNYQRPHLVLINRALIQNEGRKFEAIKNFMDSNFCYCITYSQDELFDIEDFKKNYPFAMHSPSPINISLLESMIEKLEEKLPEHLRSDGKKIYFGKHSPYSRLTLHSPCQIRELALSGAEIILPFPISNFCACEISSNTFALANLSRGQFFRSFTGKVGPAGNYHRLIFMGQNVKENELVKEATEKIADVGFEAWTRSETDVDKK